MNRKDIIFNQILIVCGVKNESIQRRLLSEPELTHKKAVEIAVALETSAKQVKDLGAKNDIEDRSLTNVNKVNETQRSGDTDRHNDCYRCGGKHRASSCLWFANCFKIQQKIFIQLQQLYSHSSKIFIQLQQLYSHSRKILIQLQQLYSYSRKIFIQLHQSTIGFTFKKNIYSTSTIGFCSTSSSKICIQGFNPQNPTCSQVTDQTQHGGNHRRRYQNMFHSDSWT